MDFLNKVISGDGNGSNQAHGGGNSASGTNSGNQGDGSNAGNGGSGGGFMDKINSLAGGGQQGEQNEDGLDKAVDFVQEKFLGQGKQDNESASEQAKDEAISDLIRDKYRQTTGQEFFIKDKDKKFGV